MRLVFMGTPEFSLPTLENLHVKHEIISVFSQPDKPRGRHLHLAFSPVKKYAVQNNIPLLQPERLSNDPELVAELQRLNPEAIVVAAYGKIIPKWLLELPRYGCINLHASLLPAYRGAAPIQRAILDGCEETGVTTMKMAEGLDTGEIYLQSAIKIATDDTAESLGEKLAAIGAELILNTLDGLKSGNLKPVPQDNSKATTANKIEKDEMRVHWDMGYKEICLLVRALAPHPGAYTYIKNNRVKILEAAPITNGGNTIGKIVSARNELVIAAKSGAVKILKIQPEGKRVIAGDEYVRGYRLRVGDFV